MAFGSSSTVRVFDGTGSHMVEVAGLERLPDDAPFEEEDVVLAFRSSPADSGGGQDRGREWPILEGAWRAASGLGMGPTAGFRGAPERASLRVSLPLDGPGEVVPFPPAINAGSPKDAAVRATGCWPRGGGARPGRRAHEGTTRPRPSRSIQTRRSERRQAMMS